ncbi:flagellar assembly protein FliH [Falsibacillus pallidus]|uniref:Flagellar assembly protein FliH n=1 Tax=Falsibacillus pallidus TaxID=493781 RepID=A0A370GVC6_9BACI|nr:flagellar assembly protein FliH [Falsibacillus pallidus]RDI47459.1 flagellar assembly protein FliH [Falsibacillus pallidus]
MSRIIKSSWKSGQEISQTKVIGLKQIVSEYAAEFESNQLMEKSEGKEREAIINAAKEEAESIRLNAEKELKELRESFQLERDQFEMEKAAWIEQAKKEGFESGFQDGRIQAMQEFSGYIQKAREVVDLSKVEFSNYLESAEKVILELGVKIAEKILNKELTEHPDTFIGVVKKALKEVKEFKEVQIHVHPLKYDLLMGQKEDLETLFPFDVNCYIYPDEDLPENSCYIESQNGRVDAGIDSQLIEIKRQLLNILEGDVN